MKYTSRLSSGDQAGAVAPSPRNARAGPPVKEMSDFGALELLPPCVNQTSAPSPEKPRVLMIPGTLSAGRSLVRLEILPVPTWLRNRSNLPSRSAAKATNLPSGEIDAPASVPGQSVSRENLALARGFSTGRGVAPRVSQ